MGSYLCESSSNRMELPDDLKSMLLADRLSVGRRYIIKPILDYLLDHMLDNKDELTETTPQEIIFWIDSTFERCLFPLEFNSEEAWESYPEEIRQILERAEDLLLDLPATFFRNGYDTPQDMITGNLNILQRFNIYFSVLYIHTNELDKLEERLEQLLSYSKRSVQLLLGYKEEEAMSVVESRLGYHSPGMDRLEPINWLEREYIPNTEARKLYTRVYERYANSLFDLMNDWRSSRVAARIHENAEKRLRGLCDLILYRLAEDHEAPSGNEEKEAYEAILQRSLERSAAAIGTPLHPVDNLAEVPDRRKGFSTGLCELMKTQNLPLVIALCPAEKDEDPDQAIAYLRDESSGSIWEKSLTSYGLKELIYEIVSGAFDCPF